MAPLPQWIKAVGGAAIMAAERAAGNVIEPDSAIAMRRLAVCRSCPRRPIARVSKARPERVQWECPACGCPIAASTKSVHAEPDLGSPQTIPAGKALCVNHRCPDGLWEQ